MSGQSLTFELELEGESLLVRSWGLRDWAGGDARRAFALQSNAPPQGKDQ